MQWAWTNHGIRHARVMHAMLTLLVVLDIAHGQDVRNTLLGVVLVVSDIAWSFVSDKRTDTHRRLERSTPIPRIVGLGFSLSIAILLVASRHYPGAADIVMHLVWVYLAMANPPRGLHHRKPRRAPVGMVPQGA